MQFGTWVSTRGRELGDIFLGWAPLLPQEMNQLKNKGCVGFLQAMVFTWLQQKSEKPWAGFVIPDGGAGDVGVGGGAVEQCARVRCRDELRKTSTMVF